jgi:membrane protein
MNIKAVFHKIVDFFDKFSDDQTWTLSAALSYYAIFSIPPIFILIINTSGYILGEPTVQEALYSELGGVMGQSGIDQIRAMVDQSGILKASFFRTVINVGILIFTATTIFVVTQRALNTIFRVKSKPKNGFMDFLKLRFFSFSIILGISIILVLTLLLDALVGAFFDFILQWLPGIDKVVLSVVSWSLQLLVTAVLVALIYRLLPDVRLRTREILFGSLLTALLFALGRYGIGFAIAQANLTDVYQAAGAIVVLMLWVYYTSLIFFFSAQVTYFFASRKGRWIAPTSEAVRYHNVEITEDEYATGKKRRY